MEEDGRTELANDLAVTLNNKGNALDTLGRAGEALEAHAEAERIRRRLVEEEGRTELANDLARTLNNKGIALAALGRAGDALEAFAEAERIWRRLVEEEGRTELANDLAGTLSNKGDALRALGRAGDALEAFAEAERIRRRLVEEGRTELANGLAGTLNNKGNDLDTLGRTGDALAAYAEAERIFHRLVEGEGRTELANDLADTLTNKGNALQTLGRAGEALEARREAAAFRKIFADHLFVALTSELPIGPTGAGALLTLLNNTDTSSATEWPIPPLIPGDWRALRGHAANALRLAMEQSAPVGPEGSNIRRLRARLLPFYGDWLLVEGEVHDIDGPLGLMQALFGTEGVIPLDGTCTQIHQVNATQIKLTGEADILDYARFFCSAIRGADGRFQLVDDIDWIHRADGAVIGDVTNLGSPPAPPRVVTFDAEGPSRVEAVLQYTNAVFLATLTVYPSGWSAWTTTRCSAGICPPARGVRRADPSASRPYALQGW